MKERHLACLVLTALSMFIFCSCSNGTNPKSDTPAIEDQKTIPDTNAEPDNISYNDLALFEAHGKVKTICKHLLSDDQIIKKGKNYVAKDIPICFPFAIDTFATNGKCLHTAYDGLIKRDSCGTIVKIIYDEGVFEYEWKNGLVSSVIFDYDSRVCYVYDAKGLKSKETDYFKDPNESNSSYKKQSYSSYHYTKFDDQGNWTERWSETHFLDGSTTSNNVEIREIKYYDE